MIPREHIDNAFPENYQQIIACTVKGYTQEQVAIEADCSVRTVQRVQKLPEVRKAIEDMCRELWAQRKLKLENNLDVASDGFLELSKDDNPFVRLGACQQLKSLAFEAKDRGYDEKLAELSQKVALLEQRTRTGGALPAPEDEDESEESDS